MKFRYMKDQVLKGRGGQSLRGPSFAENVGIKTRANSMENGQLLLSLYVVYVVLVRDSSVITGSELTA